MTQTGSNSMFCSVIFSYIKIYDGCHSVSVNIELCDCRHNWSIFHCMMCWVSLLLIHIYDISSLHCFKHTEMNIFVDRSFHICTIIPSGQVLRNESIGSKKYTFYIWVNIVKLPSQKVVPLYILTIRGYHQSFTICLNKRALSSRAKQQQNP